MANNPEQADIPPVGDLDVTTDYEIGQDNIQPFGLDIHNPAFVISASFIVIFVALSLSFQEQSAEFFGWFRPWLTSTFDWFLMFAVNIMLVFCVFLAISPLGKVRIGGKDAKPDYSYAGWIAMLFSAGIGIGLLFFGVLELMYYSLPELSALPLGLDPTAPGNENMAIVATVSMGILFTVVVLAMCYCLYVAQHSERMKI